MRNNHRRQEIVKTDKSSLPRRPNRHLLLTLLFFSTLLSLLLLPMTRPASTQKPDALPNKLWRPRSSNIQQIPAPKVEYVNGREAAAGEVLVKFRPQSSAQSPQQRAARIQQLAEVVPVRQVGHGEIQLVRSQGKDVATLVKELSAQPEVEFAEPNYVLYARTVPNDTRFAELWGMRNTGQLIQGVLGTAGADISATEAWNVTTGSRSHVVGVVDSGIDYNHPDLAANVWSAPAAFTVNIGGQEIRCAAGTHGFNAIDKTCDPIDDVAHGTHVAGIIGAAGANARGVVGVNWRASMMGLKFLDAFGRGHTSEAIDALEFAVQAKRAFASTGGADIRVLNNSWGGGFFSQALLDGIKRTYESDMLFVAASGNGDERGRGFNNDFTRSYPDGYDVPNIVAVAASDNRDELAPFSNYGEKSVHLAAPGVGVLSTVPQGAYEYFDGTSMAAPHVSGAAALLLSRCNMNAQSLKLAILNNVDPAPSLAKKVSSGGRLNVNKMFSSCSEVPDFSINSAGESRAVKPGAAASFQINVHPLWGYSGTLNLSVSGLPKNASANFTPQSLTLQGTFPKTSVLTVRTNASTPAGTYPLTVKATDGSRQKSLKVWLVVAEYSVIDLGTLYGEYSAAYGINNWGQVTGDSDGRAFLYDPTTKIMTDLGTLREGTSSYAQAINDAGQVTGVSNTHAFLYNPVAKKMVDIGAHLFADLSHGYGINNRGQIVGMTYGSSTDYSLRAFLYDSATKKVTALGTILNDEYASSEALDVNDSGQVVGSSNARGFLYENGSMKNIGQLYEGAGTEANAINNAGEIVGQSGTRAFLYRGGEMFNLGSLPYHDVADALGINEYAQVVGSSRFLTDMYRPFYYYNGAMIDLNDVIPAESGWSLWRAHGINDAGEIVGLGLINGREHAFMLKPKVAVNKRPEVKLISPTSGEKFNAPVDITFSASVRDDRPVKKVDFYANDTLVGADSGGKTPFTFIWREVPPGDYMLTAVVTDASGVAATSNAVSIQVNAGSGGGEPLPAPWQGRDIGSLVAGGSDGYEGGVFTLRGAGADIYGGADSFHYVYQPLSGDGQIVARVTDITGGDGYAVAGLMIRESLAADSRHASVLAMPGGKTKFRYRSNTGASTTSQGVGGTTTVPLPQWVKLVRQGNVFTGYRSADGIHWQATSSATVTMNGNVLIGLATASHSASVLSSSVIDHVRLGFPGEEVRALPAAADAYVQDGAAATQNFGPAPDLRVKRSPSAGYHRRAYLKFDLSQLPDQIAGATLRLHGQLTSGGTGIPVGVYAVADAGWDESQITWNNKPPTASAALTSQVVTDDEGRWYEFDLTSFIQAERAAGRQSISLALRGIEPSSAYPVFHSREADDNQPELFVATAGGGGGGFGVRINFQPATAPAPAGFVADTGAAYADRGNGLTFGWTSDVSANARDRNSSAAPNQAYDTLIYMQRGGAHAWEIAVPNGTYVVRVVAGDPTYYSTQTYRIAVEGTLTVDGQPSSAARWVEGTKSVTVTDGKLTVTSAAGAVENEICFVEIAQR